jgi:hypothetical protein
MLQATENPNAGSYRTKAIRPADAGLGEGLGGEEAVPGLEPIVLPEVGDGAALGGDAELLGIEHAATRAITPTRARARRAIARTRGGSNRSVKAFRPTAYMGRLGPFRAGSDVAVLFGTRRRPTLRRRASITEQGTTTA